MPGAPATTSEALMAYQTDGGSHPVSVGTEMIPKTPSPTRRELAKTHPMNISYFTPFHSVCLHTTT